MWLADFLFLIFVARLDKIVPLHVAVMLDAEKKTTSFQILANTLIPASACCLSEGLQIRVSVVPKALEWVHLLSPPVLMHRGSKAWLSVTRKKSSHWLCQWESLTKQWTYGPT